MRADDSVLDAAQSSGRALRARGGYTLPEALLVLAILGIVSGMAAVSFQELSNPRENAVSESAAFLRTVRQRAIAKTSAYRVVVVSATELRGEWARTCDDEEWTQDPELVVRLAERVTVTVPGVAAGESMVCFNSRGVASGNPRLAISDHVGRSVEVEVFVGGGVRVNR